MGVKISDLPDSGAVTGAELIEIVQSSASRKTTVAAVRDGLALASDLTTHESDAANPHAVTAAQVGLGNVDNTSDADKPVSTAAQTALNAKVGKTGDESIAGIKTFESSPLVPAGADGLEAVAAQDVGALAAAQNGLAGQVAFFAKNTAPTGWLKANGAAVSRTTYAALFAAIGTSFGVGNGSTTFGLPDLRGEFPRGWDDARGVDSGRAFGSAQSHGIQQGSFQIRRTGAGFTTALNATGSVSLGTSAETTVTLAADAVSHPHDIVYIGSATETRGRNIALLACIKY